MYYDLKKLKKIFDQISYAQSEMNAFTDVIDFTLLAFRFYNTGEELQTAHEKLTTYPRRELIGQFMTELAELNPAGLADPLGEFYMMHISYGRLGLRRNQVVWFIRISNLMIVINKLWKHRGKSKKSYRGECLICPSLYQLRFFFLLFYPRLNGGRGRHYWVPVKDEKGMAKKAKNYECEPGRKFTEPHITSNR